jgi:large conductance mechanosensitive channel
MEGCAMLKEFKGFLTKSNALALAVGVIIGGATGKVVTSVVEDLLMPIIALLLPSGDWKEGGLILGKKLLDGKETTIILKYGHFLGTLVDFVIIAFVVFVVTKALLRPEPAPAPPATKACPDCLETIPSAATKCKACGSAQPAE